MEPGEKLRQNGLGSSVTVGRVKWEFDSLGLAWCIMENYCPAVLPCLAVLLLPSPHLALLLRSRALLVALRIPRGFASCPVAAVQYLQLCPSQGGP